MDDKIVEDITNPAEILRDGWGIMPNRVNFSKQISDGAKILYTYISSLCASEGWCWASNRHFATKYGKSQRQIIRLLQELQDADLVFANYEGSESRRKLTVFISSNDVQKMSRGMTKMSRGYDKNVTHNNINIIKEKYTKEILEQIEKLYTGYVLYFKVDQDDYKLSDDNRKAELLARAKNRYKLTDKRKAKLATRIKDNGYDNVKQAIINCSKSDWHRGTDPKSNWYAQLEWICQSYEKVEEWATKYEN